MSDHSSQRSPLLAPVPWTVFAWAVGIVSALFIGVFGFVNSLSAKVERNESREQEVLVQLSQIQADLKNLEYLIKSNK